MNLMKIGVEELCTKGRIKVRTFANSEFMFYTMAAEPQHRIL